MCARTISRRRACVCLRERAFTRVALCSCASLRVAARLLWRSRWKREGDIMVGSLRRKARSKVGGIMARWEAPFKPFSRGRRGRRVACTACTTMKRERRFSLLLGVRGAVYPRKKKKRAAGVAAPKGIILSRGVGSGGCIRRRREESPFVILTRGGRPLRLANTAQRCRSCEVAFTNLSARRY